MQNRKKTGFTLIELLVVATIIIVLAAIGLTSFTNAGKSARNSKRRSDLETVRQALVLYKSDNGNYLTAVGVSEQQKYISLVASLSSGYLSSPTPADPKAGDFNCGPSGGLECNYRYNGNPTTFTLTAPMEGEPNYVLTNP